FVGLRIASSAACRIAGSRHYPPSWVEATSRWIQWFMGRPLQWVLRSGASLPGAGPSCPAPGDTSAARLPAAPPSRAAKPRGGKVRERGKPGCGLAASRFLCARGECGIGSNPVAASTGLDPIPHSPTLASSVASRYTPSPLPINAGILRLGRARAMGAYHLLLASALLTASGETMPLEKIGAWHASLAPGVRLIALEWQILDARELGRVLVHPAAFAKDVKVLQERMRKLQHAPLLEERGRFPPLRLVEQLIANNRKYHTELQQRLEIDPLHADELRDAMDEAEQLFRVWDTLRDALTE